MTTTIRCRPRDAAALEVFYEDSVLPRKPGTRGSFRRRRDAEQVLLQERVTRQVFNELRGRNLTGNRPSARKLGCDVTCCYVQVPVSVRGTSNPPDMKEHEFTPLDQF